MLGTLGMSGAWPGACCTAGSSRAGARPSSPEAVVGVQGPFLPLAALARTVQPVGRNHHEDEVGVVVVLLLPKAPQIPTAVIVLTVHPCGREGRNATISRLRQGAWGLLSRRPVTAQEEGRGGP